MNKPVQDAATFRAQQFAQRHVRLQSGAVLAEVRTAYITLGTLAPDGRNAVLVTHGYTSGPSMLDPHADSAEGSWGELVGPGRAVDTNRYFVVCANALGSSFGSTNAASIDPATGRPYGSRFPEVTMSDIVAGQHALLDHLGVKHLVCVIGPSFGASQVFQWGVDYPDAMDALVSVVGAPVIRQANVADMEARLANSHDWQGGDYYGKPDAMRDFLYHMRIGTLTTYGIDALLAEHFPEAEDRAAEVRRLARDWSQVFDANSLLILMGVSASYDVSRDLHRIRAPLLYVLSRTDRMFPPKLAEEWLPQLKHAGVDARYVEIDSEHGHFASGTDAEKWAPALRAFLASVDTAE